MTNNNNQGSYKIAVDAADLCYNRVDGTRIYIQNLLDKIGLVDKNNKYLIYLKGKVNKQLEFKKFKNYILKKSYSPFFWTQLKFPFELARDKPDLLWMPLQTVPFYLPKNIKVVVTIHDLAFKVYGRYFLSKDHFLLTNFTKQAIKRADKIIAVSENTRRDIIKYYQVSPNKVAVVYHGYNQKLFNPEKAKNTAKIEKVMAKYNINSRYIIYTGAIQPRKNLKLLIKAFKKLKDYYIYHQEFKDLKLVIAGEKAWMHEGVTKAARESRYSTDIIFTGQFETQELPYLLGGAELFVLPSLYEGFGMPMLEAMACGIPVVAARNSSLTEVGGEAVRYFHEKRLDDLFNSLVEVLKDQKAQKKMIKKGLKQVGKFSWDRCANETCRVFESVLN
ncbi:MAG: glycosyltransferase [Candidatus Moranbacteria bacterium]|nr:glycosyltransferase [Candidatus Moranbacteria bacterium]